MDQVALVANQLADGEDLLNRLARSGFDIAAAAWVNASEENRWFLYIASKNVDAEGPTAAIRTVHAAIYSTPGSWIDPFEVKLVGASDPIAKALKSILLSRPWQMPTRYRGIDLGGLPIGEAYIYPLPATVPAAGS